MKRENKQDLQTEEYKGRAYAYTAAGLTAGGAISFGLSFTVLGIYALIAAVLLALGALSFARLQKKKNNFKRLILIVIAAYAVLAVSAAFFTGGIIWASLKNGG